MTYIRAFGGGISSALKSAMNAVLNKKFGTSTTYDPAGWPDDVNLLGKLPEKTVSGTIAHITDGADEVPIKSWEVEIAPTLTGKSAIEATQTGKNLVDVSTATGTGTIWFHYDNGIELKKGVTYTFSCGNYGTGSIALYGIDHSTQVAYTYISASSAQVTYTPTENITVCPRIYQSGLTISNLVNVQLEVGSTATTYEPYTAPTVSTVQLGRTIYGGSADVVTGEGQETHKGHTLDNLTWSGSLFDGNWVWYTDLSADGLKLPFASNVFSGICDTYTPISFTEVSSNTNTIALRNNGSLYVNNGSSETEPTGKVTIELATPTDFTFTPITPTPQTPLGTSNFWADTGDSEVTYRADIALALAANSSRGLMMASRSIPEDEILNENTEEVENDENIRQDPEDR